MASLNEFISEVKNSGLMRNSRFAVQFNLPNNMDRSYGANLQSMLLFCDAVNLPGLTIESAASRIYGEIREMPYGKIFDAVNMSFYVDNDMSVKLLFDAWMALIMDPTTRHFQYYNNYTTDIQITVFDIADGARYKVTLYECYPKSVGSVQMDYSNKDVMKLNVNMMYKYWESDTMTSDNATGISATVNALVDNLTDPRAIPQQYFSNFRSFQSGITSMLGGLGG
jgi:hypothetical protein